MGIRAAQPEGGLKCTVERCSLQKNKTADATNDDVLQVCSPRYEVSSKPQA